MSSEYRPSKESRKQPGSGASRLSTGITGLIAGLIVGGLLSPALLKGESRDGEDLVEIVVARRTIPAGTELGYAVLMRAKMPARFASSSMLRPEHVGHLVGEIALVTVLEGDPIFWSHLAAGAPESICRWVREANESRIEDLSCPRAAR